MTIDAENEPDLPESVHAWLPREVAERLLVAGQAWIDPNSGVMYVDERGCDHYLGVSPLEALRDTIRQEDAAQRQPSPSASQDEFGQRCPSCGCRCASVAPEGYSQ